MTVFSAVQFSSRSPDGGDGDFCTMTVFLRCLSYYVDTEAYINYSHQHPVFQSLPRDVDIFAATAMGRPLGAALGARRLSLLEEHSLKTSTPTRLTGDDGDYDGDGDSDDELPQSSHWEETPVLRPPFVNYLISNYVYIHR